MLATERDKSRQRKGVEAWYTEKASLGQPIWKQVRLPACEFRDWAYEREVQEGKKKEREYSGVEKMCWSSVVLCFLFLFPTEQCFLCASNPCTTYMMTRNLVLHPWESIFKAFPPSSYLQAWDITPWSSTLALDLFSNLSPNCISLWSIYSSMDLWYIMYDCDSSVTYTRVVTAPKVYKTT